MSWPLSPGTRSRSGALPLPRPPLSPPRPCPRPRPSRGADGSPRVLGAPRCVALLRTKYSLERVEGGSLEVSAVPPRRRKPAGRRGRSGEAAAREQPGDAAGAASALGGRGAQGAVGERLLLTDESADGLSSGDEASGAGASSSDAASAPTASLDTDGIVAGFVEHRRDLPWGAVAAALHSHGSPPPPFSPDRRLGPKLSPPLPEHAPHPTSPGSPSAPALPRTLRTKPCGVAGVAGGAGSASLAGAASARGVPSAPVLMRAARSGRVAEVRAAIRALCPPGGGAPVAREALTDALVAAAAAGLLDVCFCLLEHGADARARGTGGASAGEVLAEGSLGPQRRALHVMGFPDAGAPPSPPPVLTGHVSSLPPVLTGHVSRSRVRCSAPREPRGGLARRARPLVSARGRAPAPALACL